MAHHDSTDLETRYSRRRLLQAGGMMSAVLLAGCQGDGAGDQDPATDTPTGISGNTETQSNTTTETEDSDSTETETATSGSQEWPQFQFDAQNTGHNPGGVGPKENIRVKWRFNVGTAVQTAPVVKDGVVYVNADQLYALSTEDGSVEWTFAQSGGGSSPAVGDESVFVSGAGDAVYDLNTSDGSVKWENSFAPRLSSPSIMGPRVFFNSASGLAAFDAETGDKLWKVPKDQSKEFAYFSPPVISNGNVYTEDHNLATGNAFLKAFDVGDGSQQLSERIFSWGPVPLTIVDGRVYFRLGDRFLAGRSVRETDYEFKMEFDATIVSSPAATSSNFYISTEDNFLHSVNRNKEIEWSFDIGADSESSPAIADGVVYFGSNDRNVYAVDATSGDELWSYETGRIVQSPPAVAGGTVYIGSDDGYIYALAEN